MSHIPLTHPILHTLMLDMRSTCYFNVSTADGWRQSSQRWHRRWRPGSVHWRHRHGGHEPPGGPEQDQELHRQPQPHSAEVSHKLRARLDPHPPITPPPNMHTSVRSDLSQEQEDIYLHDSAGGRRSLPYTLKHPFRFEAALQSDHRDSASMQMPAVVSHTVTPSVVGVFRR